MIDISKSWEWKKRRIRYGVNNSVVGSLVMRIWKEIEELIWLGICVDILVVIVNVLDLGII